jgi:serine/threonine-protein kinase
MIREGMVIGGKYRLSRLVGKGAMGTVWSARHEQLGRQVAVKLIHSSRQLSPSAAERFFQEARIAAAIQHRYVIDLFDFGETDQGLPYMVMELLQGESLAVRASSPSPLSVRTFLELMEMVLAGLSAAHETGVIHRDLKPENIFLVRQQDEYFPKILDFGISLVTKQESRPPEAQRGPGEASLLGTPCYMSPEQFGQVEHLDHRTDLYSMGVMMYEVLTGCLPFSAPALEELIVQIRSARPPPVDGIRPELGPELGQLIARAMSKVRNERFADAQAMRQAIRQLQWKDTELLTAVLTRFPATTDLDIALTSQGDSAPQGRTPARQRQDQSQTLDEGAGTAKPKLGLFGRKMWRVVIAVGLTVLAGFATGLAVVMRDTPAAAVAEESQASTVPSSDATSVAPTAHPPTDAGRLGSTQGDSGPDEGAAGNNSAPIVHDANGQVDGSPGGDSQRDRDTQDTPGSSRQPRVTSRDRSSRRRRTRRSPRRRPASRKRGRMTRHAYDDPGF